MSYREDNALAGLVLVAVGLVGYGAWLGAVWLWKHLYCLLAGF